MLNDEKSKQTFELLKNMGNDINKVAFEFYEQGINYNSEVIQQNAARMRKNHELFNSFKKVCEAAMDNHIHSWYLVGYDQMFYSLVTLVVDNMQYNFDGPLVQVERE